MCDCSTSCWQTPWGILWDYCWGLHSYNVGFNWPTRCSSGISAPLSTKKSHCINGYPLKDFCLRDTNGEAQPYLNVSLLSSNVHSSHYKEKKDSSKFREIQRRVRHLRLACCGRCTEGGKSRNGTSSAEFLKNRSEDVQRSRIRILPISTNTVSEFTFC